MKRVCLAAAAAMSCCLQMAAGDARMAADDLQRDVLSIAYTKEKGLVAAAYRGGQVVVWDFESGRVKNVYNASAPKSTLNRPLAHFSAGGRRLAFTQEGDAGLISYNADTGASTVLVPHRLLVKGITAFSWSQQADSVMVAIGRDIFLIDAQGHTQWQHRLETRAIITDVVWHPSEKYYTVATDDGVVSTWEATSGRVIASSKLETGGHSATVKVGWTSEDSLVASVRGLSLAALDPETLKPKKITACNCLDFTWSPEGKELFAWAPPAIAVFGESGQRTREIRTPFAGEGPIEWAGEGRLLTAFSDSAVVLRDARTGKILRTFAP
jgi:WD40 repeat protein